jgi:hypothetical protein
MKKRISRILGVILSLALLSGLAMVAPVSASDPIGDPDVYNDWEDLCQPKVMPGSDVELMAQAVDGTLFVSVFDGTNWDIYRSEDGGWTWSKTKFADYGAPVNAIDCAPNWDTNPTFYVGTQDGQVFRCQNAGKEEPVLLRQVVDSVPIAASVIHDLDTWSDGNDVWILVATNRDVMVMKDDLFASWIDMDLTISFDGLHTSQNGTPQGFFSQALVSRFAPDFDQSGLIWSIVRDLAGDAWITATISPGQWGQVVNSVEIPSPGTLHAVVDLDFAEFYSSTSAPVVYAALGFWGTDIADGVYEVAGAFLNDLTVATNLNVGPFGTDFMSVQVSGEVIMAGEYWAADVWTSRNGGDTWTPAAKPPTGQGGTQVLMAPGAFDPDTGVAYATTRGLESAFSYTNDGGVTWNQIGFWDTEIDYKLDIAFDPCGPGAILLTENTGAGVLGWPYAHSVWRTDDITAKCPKWERVLTDTISSPFDDFYLAAYIMDCSGIMLAALDGPDMVVLKSVDNGQTWNLWRTLPVTMGYINDWVIFDGATMFAACSNGFYGTTRFGPAKQRLIGTNLNTIALQPGFDLNDPDNQTVLVGAMFSGNAVISFDAGNVWQDPDYIGPGDVYVAFNNDGTPYFATYNGGVYMAGEIKATGLADIKMVKDSQGDVASADQFGGIYIAPDDALYVIAHYIDTDTVYDYEAEGSICLVGQAEFWGNITVEGLAAPGTTLVIYGSGLADDTIEDPVGTFIPMEALNIIGANLEVVAGPDVVGFVQVQGAVSGATGWVTIDAQSAPGFVVGDTVLVIDSVVHAYYAPEQCIALVDEALVGTFIDLEALNIINCNLIGNATGGVTGSVTVMGASSGNTSAIAIDIATDLGYSDGEVISCLSSNLEVDEVASVGSVTYDEKLIRLLKHEPKPCGNGNVWEYIDSAGAWPRLWGNTGYNNVWTLGGDGSEMWFLEDTLSGPVTGVTVTKIGETKATVNWAAVVGGEDSNGDDNDIVYEVALLMETAGKPVCVPITPGLTDKTSMLISGLDDNEDYIVHVRVAPQPDSVYSSRWSAAASFTTLEAICVPENLVPENGMQDAPLLPSFVWEDPCGNAVEFQFQLSTDPGMATLLVDITTENTAYTIEPGDELEYDTNHYWRVRAISGTGTMSDWCFSNFHTRVEPIPPVTVEPPPTPTIPLTVVPPDVIVEPPDITVTAPAPQVTVVPPDITVDVPPVVTVTQQPVPTIQLPPEEDPGTPVYIWVIVAIGAVLTVAVIVLIIRTRRVV